MGSREQFRQSQSPGRSPGSSFQSTVEGFVAAIPVLRRLTSQETYYCQICLNNHPIPDGFQLSSCSHRFCSDCLRRYVELRLHEAAIYGLLCPFLPDVHAQGLNTGCATEIPDEEVRRLCGEETLLQLQRFRSMRQDESYRECPRCQARVTGGGGRLRSLTCSQCSLVFCFVHGDAHPGQSCWQFEWSQGVRNLTAAAHLATVSRKCPCCGMKIIKDGGCNHMTCAYCGADFCWLCGRHLGDAVERHYASWNLCGCPGMQMWEQIGRCPTYCLTPSMWCLRVLVPSLRLLLLLLTVTLWLLWPFLWIAYFALMTPWCFCFYCLRCLNFRPSCPPGRLTVGSLIALSLAGCWNLLCDGHFDSECCDSD